MQYHVDLLTGVCLIVRKERFRRKLHQELSCCVRSARWKTLLLSLFCMRSPHFLQSFLQALGCELFASFRNTLRVACLLLGASLNFKRYFLHQKALLCIELKIVCSVRSRGLPSRFCHGMFRQENVKLISNIVWILN